jgi:hypothetical protein
VVERVPFFPFLPAAAFFLKMPSGDKENPFYTYVYIYLYLAAL